MLNLFGNKSKVKAGKQTAPAQSAGAGKKQSPLAGISGTWKKLNSMDRKQAYTWGAIVLVGLVALMMLGSMASTDPDDFSEYESRGYDLANMPFSSDEAEAYLLAAKYPDMQDTNAIGLYSADEKAARQAEDEEDEEEDYDEDYDEDEDASSTNQYSNTTPGRYYGNSGGSRGGSGAKTNVGRLSSANLKGASGSGMSGNFGPRGDFSNFKSQDRGNDKAPVTRGSGNARKALFQAAMGSRAAAGLKDGKLANAKRAMIGGNIDGSKAFMDDSGAVNLGEAKGLNLDTNAPVSGVDLSGLDDALADAQQQAKEEAKEEDEAEWYEEMGRRLLEQFLSGVMNKLLDSAGNLLDDQIEAAKYARAQSSSEFLEVSRTVDGQQQNYVREAYDTYLADAQANRKWYQRMWQSNESWAMKQTRKDFPSEYSTTYRSNKAEYYQKYGHSTGNNSSNPCGNRGGVFNTTSKTWTCN